MQTPPPLPSHHRRASLARAVKDNVFLLFGAVGLVWGLEILDFFLGGFFNRFGVVPRTMPGLVGVVASPFLHINFSHLISNTIPFLILGGMILLGGRKVFCTISLFILLVGGMALWTLGPSATNHIGASGLVFGYLGFLLSRGIFERSGFWIAVSVVILLVYGGMVGGIFPSRPDISWQGHLFGFLAGIVGARVMFTRPSALPPGSPMSQ